MTKVLLTIEERLLRRVDAAARKLGLTRSAFMVRLAEKELGAATGPGRDPKVRRALREIQELFARNPTPGDPTEIVRRMRDERGEGLWRRLNEAR